MNRSQCKIESGPDRRGIAPLEMVMALPIIILLWAFIFWLGLFFLNWTDVTVGARREAWLKRDQPSSRADAFDFKKIDTVKENQRRPVKFGPFGNNPVPEHTHEVLVGAWDYRAIPLDRQMHWELYPRLGGKMLAGKWDLLRGQLDVGKQMISGLTNVNSAASFLGEGGQYADIVNQQGSLNGAFGQKLDSAKLESAGKIKELRDKAGQLESDRKQIVDSREQLTQEVRGLEQAIEKDKQEKKLTAEMKKKLQDRIDVIRDKELPSLEKDLTRVNGEIKFNRSSATAQEAILNKYK